MDSDSALLVDEHTAAKLVGLSTATLRRDRRDGRLGISFIKIGAAIRYSPPALEKWIAERLAPTPPAAAPAPPRRRGRPRKSARGVAK